ncbi:MAG: immune inhibitor A [Acidimicrobiia bacterium]|nr:immune inhibitor A [Acidimicrobiia bacterium]
MRAAEGGIPGLPASGQAVSPPAAIFYGNTLSNSYVTAAFEFPPFLVDTPNSGTATSPALALPDVQEHELSFQCWIDIEAEPTRDLFTISVKTADGTLTRVWSKEEAPNFGPSWEECVVDLDGFEGQTVHLVFAFDTVDTTNNQGSGIYLDDFRVIDTCSPH